MVAHLLTVEELPHLEGTFYMGERNGLTRKLVSGVFSYKHIDHMWAPSVDIDGGVVTMSFGNDVPHNNMQPYFVVYIFKRTA